MTNKTVVDPTKPATIGEINNDLDHPIDMEQLWAADQHDDRFDRLGSEQAERGRTSKSAWQACVNDSVSPKPISPGRSG